MKMNGVIRPKDYSSHILNLPSFKDLAEEETSDITILKITLIVIGLCAVSVIGHTTEKKHWEDQNNEKEIMFSMWNA